MYAKVNGIELYYEVHGPDNAPAIVSLHGGPGISDHQKGKEAFKPLTDNYRLVVYDHRGCGQSSVTEPYSNEQYAKDCEGLIQHLGLDEVVLIGGSYGGFITQEYAVRFGDRDHFKGFVLRDTAASNAYENNSVKNARESWDAMKARDFDLPDITWEEFMRVMDGNVESDEEFERIWLGMLPLYAPNLDEFDEEAAKEAIAERRFHYETHNEMFTNAYPNMDYTEDLPGLKIPGLVTVGRHDWITPPEASIEIADLLPDSRLEIFEESGHSPNLDQQDKYIARVREFFEEIGFGEQYEDDGAETEADGST
ncbi:MULTISPECIES: alpha/beta fold hydrolase [Halorubrum]|uniref:Alpha/beta hydrolase n=1 Tax=Halorubrum ezzemoulense TaxID=337243 RepID=A0A256JDB4_HALEZ|nr:MULTISPECIES: alpha/beta hydrolase [Halorubrum]MDB2282700.1 alpha/beta hydrolase [Halorubrum ezzemoulense]OYR66566.1 alpha/beta hydrolase [Halorubrum ezzemoulense]TKX37672.1 alpha/beta hydrolase [Halorubrum sp. CGM5_25_10-8B]